MGEHRCSFHGGKLKFQKLYRVNSCSGLAAQHVGAALGGTCCPMETGCVQAKALLGGCDGGLTQKHRMMPAGEENRVSGLGRFFSNSFLRL